MVAAVAILVVTGARAAPANPPVAVLESTEVSPSGTLVARFSSADGAMEYWDVTAWFDSGERFFARFLVTNQGPGDRTAAAVGHLVLANGDVLPFKWGRRRGDWKPGMEGRRLEIAKATLDVSEPTIVVDIDSRKHGVQVHLEIDRQNDPTLVEDFVTPYTYEVAMPALARATITARGASSAHEVVGSGAVTHTWMARPESELIRRRDEVLARQGDRTFYLSILTLPDGSRHSEWLEQHRKGASESGGSGTVTFGDATTAGSDARYPVATEWEFGPNGSRATLSRELLRMDPLEVLPQPFRFLLSLGGEPRRVWTAATVKIDLNGNPKKPGIVRELPGIAVSTFAGPE